jgi:hypothetical protein
VTRPKPGSPWREGRDEDHLEPDVGLKDKVLAALATMAIIRRQLQRVGAGKAPLPDANAVFTLVRDQLRGKRLVRRYRRWIDRLGA